MYMLLYLLGVNSIFKINKHIICGGLNKGLKVLKFKTNFTCPLIVIVTSVSWSIN